MRSAGRIEQSKLMANFIQRITVNTLKGPEVKPRCNQADTLVSMNHLDSMEDDFAMKGGDDDDATEEDTEEEDAEEDTEEDDAEEDTEEDDADGTEVGTEAGTEAGTEEGTENWGWFLYLEGQRDGER